MTCTPSQPSSASSKDVGNTRDRVFSVVKENIELNCRRSLELKLHPTLSAEELLVKETRDFFFQLARELGVKVVPSEYAQQLKKEFAEARKILAKTLVRQDVAKRYGLAYNVLYCTRCHVSISDHPHDKANKVLIHRPDCILHNTHQRIAKKKR